MAFRGRIGVIGAGALGALYGARIARAGADVSFLLRSDYEAVRERGLRILSPQGNFTIHPPVFRRPEEMGPCDLVIVGLKATDNGSLGELLGPTVGPDTLVLTLQNGLGNEEAIAAVLHRQHGTGRIERRILGGVAFLCSNRIEPGVIQHIEYGRVRLAEFKGPAVDRTRDIAGLFEAADFPVETHDSLVQIRWEKLIWNIPFNGMGVAGGHADTKVLVTDPELRPVTRALMTEVIRAATSDGVRIEEPFADYMMELSEKMGPYKSSMQLDHEHGRPLEVEAIIGEPLRRARRAAIDVPRLSMLYAIIRRLDSIRRHDA